MTQTVKLTQSIDDREVLRAFQKQNDALDQIVNKLNRVGRAGQDAGKQSGDAFSAGAQKLQNYAAGVGTITLAWNAVKFAIQQAIKEQEIFEKRQENRRAATLTAAEAVRRTRVNFASDNTLNDDQLEGEIARVAKQTRTSIPVVAAALGSAFSAKGALSNRDAVNAVEQSLRILPGDLDSATALSGRTLDIQKASGVTDPKQILGFLKNVALSSRTTDIRAVGQSGVPAITSLLSRGDSVEQAGELFATFTSLLNDEEGSKTSTLVTNLGNKLAGFVPKTRGSDKRGSFAVPQNQIDAFEQATSTTARIEALQQNAELRRAFLGSTTFEAAGQAPVERLLASEPTALAELRQAQKNIAPLNAQQAATFEAEIARLEGGRFQPIATAEQQSQANLERFATSGFVNQQSGAARKILEDTIKQFRLSDSIGFTDLDENAVRTAFLQRQKNGESPARAAENILEIEQANQEKSGKADPEIIALLKAQREALDRLANTPQKVEVVNPGGQAPPEPAAAANNRGGN